MELLRLALVRCGGEQEQVGRGLGQPLAELVAGHLVRAPAQAMGFIHDHQVPAGGDQILETLPVVLGHLFPRPAASTVQGLHGVHGADHLWMALPEVVFPGDAAVGGEVARDEQAELLPEVGAHLRDPLGHQALRGDHQRPPHQAPELDSRMMRPASMVLPRPTSSASR